ncbi:hypothetical protein RhiJN_28265 [Ceratobasidium sp. AG-Ba]|nr:hypothetical protein RhiJN_28265 [Ceratobasidium sp. AG-Ba]
MDSAATTISSPSSTSSKSSHDLYWTSHDPRDTGIIGYEGTRPIFWRLATTMAYHNATRTVIFKGTDQPNREDEVAWLDWTSVNHLGRATIGDMELPMSDLVQRGSSFRARSFVIPFDGRVFEWRRDEMFSSMYELYSSEGTLMASFEQYDVPQASSIGQLYGVMRYWYKNDDTLQLTSIISLSLIRWIALHGP